jgi:hypothetical protein
MSALADELERLARIGEPKGPTVTIGQRCDARNAIRETCLDKVWEIIAALRSTDALAVPERMPTSDELREILVRAGVDESLMTPRKALGASHDE